MILTSAPRRLGRGRWTLWMRGSYSRVRISRPIDLRKDYGEKRLICFGMLRDRMVVVGCTPRGADRHVVSMRKANDREQASIAPLLGL